MELLNPLVFASIKASSADSLNRIASRYVAKYGSEKEAVAFRRACAGLDYVTANEILDKTITAISGCDSAATAISVFVDKFSNLDMTSAYGDADKVKRINENSEGMLCTIDQQLARRRKMESFLEFIRDHWELIALVAGVVAAVVGGIAVWHLRKSSGRGKAQKAGRSSRSARRTAPAKPRYTEKDRDMIELMQELAEVYRKTDEYLKK